MLIDRISKKFSLSKDLAKLTIIVLAVSISILQYLIFSTGLIYSRFSTSSALFYFVGSSLLSLIGYRVGCWWINEFRIVSGYMTKLAIFSMAMCVSMSIMVKTPYISIIMLLIGSFFIGLCLSEKNFLERTYIPRENSENYINTIKTSLKFWKIAAPSIIVVGSITLKYNNFIVMFSLAILLILISLITPIWDEYINVIKNNPELLDEPEHPIHLHIQNNNPLVMETKIGLPHLKNLLNPYSINLSAFVGIKFITYLAFMFATLQVFKFLNTFGIIHVVMMMLSFMISSYIQNLSLFKNKINQIFIAAGIIISSFFTLSFSQYNEIFFYLFLFQFPLGWILLNHIEDSNNEIHAEYNAVIKKTLQGQLVKFFGKLVATLPIAIALLFIQDKFQSNLILGGFVIFYLIVWVHLSMRLMDNQKTRPETESNFFSV